MNHPPHVRLLIVCALLMTSPLCQADMKATIRSVITETPAPPTNVQNPMIHHTVYYRSGAMRRKEEAGGSKSPSLSSIANCKTRTGFLVFMLGREYRGYELPKPRTAAEVHEYLLKNPENPYHITLVPVESRTVDTGERKTFFGFEAKHLITTTRLASSGNGRDAEETIDGWYIDHEQQDFGCAPDSVQAEASHVIGTLLGGPTGFPERLEME